MTVTAERLDQRNLIKEQRRVQERAASKEELKTAREGG